MREGVAEGAGPRVPGTRGQRTSARSTAVYVVPYFLRWVPFLLADFFLFGSFFGVFRTLYDAGIMRHYVTVAITLARNNGSNVATVYIIMEYSK